MVSREAATNQPWPGVFPAFHQGPGKSDPVFFDPDFDTPTPISEEKMNAAALATFERAGTPRQFVYAYLRTGFMPTTQEGRANRTEEQNAEYDAALDEYFDMLDPPVAERSEFSYGDMFDNSMIEKKLVKRIADLATHVGISISVHDGKKWHDRTRDSEAIAGKVMLHVMNEPIMNEMTGKAKPKAAKLLFFDEVRKIEVGATTLQLGRGYDIAEECLGDAVEEPIEELSTTRLRSPSSISHRRTSTSRHCVPLRGASASRSSRKRTEATKNRLTTRSDRDGRTNAHQELVARGAPQQPFSSNRAKKA
jgi:hypothetical protein